MKDGKFLEALTPPTSLPDTVAVGEWLDELVGTLQSQLDMIANGAAMLPYEYLRKRYLGESIPLGATASFRHETNGTLTGRFVKLGAPNETGFARPVGYRTNSSQLYEVTDRVSESNEALFAGLDITQAGEIGEYGWILTGGVSPVLPNLTGAPTHLGEVGWVADDSLATNAATTVGRLVSNGPDLQVLLNPQPIPVNDKTLAGSIDRLNSRLDQVRAELATKPDGTQVNTLLESMVIRSITAVNQTVDLIQTQLQKIDTNLAQVEIEQTLQAMAEFRLELTDARDAQDAVRQQMHVNAQASLHNKDSSKVWADQSGVYAEASAGAEGRAAIQANESTIQAGFSAGYAANASLSEANAQSYMNLAATYRRDTLKINGNFKFDLGMEGWWTALNTITGAVSNPLELVPGFAVEPASFRPTMLRLDPGIGAKIIFSEMIPISNTADKWEFKATIAGYRAGGGTGSTQFYVGFVGLDANGAYLNHGGYGTFRYCLATPANASHNQVIDLTAIVTGEGNDSWTKFPPGTKYIRFVATMNYLNDPNFYSYLDGFSVENVTARESAIASAAAASSSSASASSSAATATSNMLLTASLGRGLLNANANFANWPVGTADPDSWYIWGGTGWGGSNKRYPMSALGLVGNQKIEGSEYAYGAVVPTAGSDVGIRTLAAGGNDIEIAPGKFTMQGTARIFSGTWSGAGLVLYFFDSAMNFLAAEYIRFWADADSNGLVSNTSGVIRRWSKSVTSPSNARFARMYVMANWGGFPSPATATKDLAVWLAGFRQSSDAEAQVQVNSGAIATINGAAAFHETIVAAGGGFPAVSRLKAGASGSTFDLAASKLTIYNPSNTSQWQEVARFEGGKAILNDALIRTLSVGPRTDSEIYFPVQLRPRAYLGKHNDVIQYEGGKTLGAVPLRITPDTTGIAVASGDALDVRAVSITATQFTVKAVKITPSSPANQATVAGSNIGGTPAWQVDKPTSADAFNGYYNFKATITLTLVNSVYNEFQDKYRNYYSGSVRLYCNSGSGWTIMETVALNPSTLTVSAAAPGSTISYAIDYTTQYNTAIGQHGGKEFGIHATSGTLTAFAGVVYTTQSSGTEVALTQMIPWLVYPPESN